MLDFIKNLFNSNSDEPVEQDGYSQSEREALIDTLLFSMYIDNHLSIAETELLERKSDSLTWDSLENKTIEMYTDEATAKVRAARNDTGKRVALLESIAKRLESPEIKDKVYSLCERLFLSDGELSDEEQKFQTELRSYIGL